MRIRKSTSLFLKSYVFLFIFLSTRMWGLYSYTKIPLYVDTFSIISIMAVSVLYAIVIIFKARGYVRIKKKVLPLLISLVAVTFVEIFNTLKINSEQSVWYTIVEASFYFSIPVVYFVFSSIVKSEQDFAWLERAFCIAAVALSCTSIFQRLVYKTIEIFPSEVSSLRNGELRVFIGGSVVFTIGYLLLVHNFLKNCVNIKNILELSICLLRVVWAEQQRAFAIILLGVSAFFFIRARIENKSLRIVLYVFLLIIGVFVSILSDFAGSLQQMFAGDMSASARMWSMEFFIRKAKEYPVLGMGFIATSNDVGSLSYRILRNEAGYLAQRSDVGLFGLLNMWGIVGIAWYMWLLSFFYKEAKINGEGASIASVIFLYCILTSFTLIVTDAQRVLLIPVFMAIVQQEEWSEPNERDIFENKPYRSRPPR